MPDPPYYQCDPTATCSLIDAAPVDPGSALCNVKVVWRRIRIQVLDVRSGLPIRRTPAQEVRIDDQPVVRYAWDGSGWDITEHFPIYKSGGAWWHGKQKLTGTLAGHGKASQIALTALGYDCGSPSEGYGPKGKAAYRAYQLDRGVAEADLAETPDEAARDAILREHNGRCYRMAQFHLASSGYAPSGDDGEALDAQATGAWTDAWRDAFHSFQRIELGTPDDKLEDWLKTKARAQSLIDARKRFVTDDDGVLRVPVPVAKIAQGFSVGVGFNDFCIVAEATLAEHEAGGDAVLHRPACSLPDGSSSPIGGATGFSVEWVQRAQETAWDKPWGWRVGRARSASAEARAALPELRTSWTFQIPGTCDAEDQTWGALQERERCFSMFYDGDERPELVVFALIWCQPVWDGIDDPDALRDRPAFNDQAYVFPGGDAHLNMHVTTVYHDLAGSDRYGGKGYGLWEYSSAPRWRGMDSAGDAQGGHRGFDIHAAIGDRVFAVHAGTASTYWSAVGGNVVKLSWTGASSTQTSIAYLHNSAYQVTSGARVRAGQVVALAGRTGNLSATSPQPGHVHLNVGTNNALYRTPDAANRICLPANERTPLLFPCHCQVTSQSPAACDFDSTPFASACWAVAELACPSMPRPITAASLAAAGAEGRKARRRLQAQLRWLHERDGATYPSPGTLDAAIGPEPPATGNYTPGSTRTAIGRFKEAQGLLPEEPTQVDRYGVDQALLDALDAQAPLLDPS